MTVKHFADKVFQAVNDKKSQVVVGLDPRPELFPPHIFNPSCLGSDNACADTAQAIIEFNRRVIEAVADIAIAVKCQIAFYERYGLEGLKAYCATIDIAKRHNLLVIGDVKRNDIGSTAEAYAAAHLPPGPSDSMINKGDCNNNYFYTDAVTVNPLFGSDGIEPFIQRAAQSGCGIFILVRTSNPSSSQIQELSCEGFPLYEHIAKLVSEWGESYKGECGYSLVGAVVGATFPSQLKKLRTLMPHTPLLIPGFGAQGGGVEDVIGGFNANGSGALVSSSRGIIYAYNREPYRDKCEISCFEDVIREAAEEMRQSLFHLE